MQKLKKWVKYISWILFGFIFIIPFSLLAWKTSSKGNSFIIANYQSYIDIIGGEDDPTTSENESYPSVENYLKDKYSVSYDYFDTAESAKNLLVKNTADIVNSTTYEIVNWVNDPRNIIHNIDWKKFGIPNINNANDALNLFTKPVQKILIAYDINGDGLKFDDPNNDKNMEDNLLNYGIPYFLQDYIFVYRGDKIAEFHSPEITWKKFFDIMTRNEAVKERFKSYKTPRMFAVEDSRTFFTISNNIYIENNKTKLTREEKFSPSHLESCYQDLANKFNSISKRSIAFNSDASVTLNKIAKHEVEGGFCYNGDALYATYGGDDAVNILEGTIHVVKPKDSIVALDMFVINNKLSGEKLDKAYEIMGELLLGIYFENDQKITPEDLNWKPELSWTYRNFNFVNYTTPLQKVYEYIEKNYFEIGEPNYETKKQIFEVNVQGPENVEEPINDLEKSNIRFKWLGFLASLK